jgi:hypothetical protein
MGKSNISPKWGLMILRFFLIICITFILFHFLSNLPNVSPYQFYKNGPFIGDYRPPKRTKYPESIFDITKISHQFNGSNFYELDFKAYDLSRLKNQSCRALDLGCGLGEGYQYWSLKLPLCEWHALTNDSKQYSKLMEKNETLVHPAKIKLGEMDQINQLYSP